MSQTLNTDFIPMPFWPVNPSIPCYVVLCYIQRMGKMSGERFDSGDLVLVRRKEEAKSRRGRTGE